MSKVIRLTYYGMDGEGPTVKEAKADAGRKLEHLVKQTEEAPVIVQVAGVAALVAFTKYGWGHRLILTTGDSRLTTGSAWVSGGRDTKHQAELSALKHCLDIAWNFPDDDETWFNDATNGIAKCGVSLTGSEARTMRGEFLAERLWQRQYRVARAQGYDDEDARYIASGLTHMTKEARARQAAQSGAQA